MKLISLISFAVWASLAQTSFAQDIIKPVKLLEITQNSEGPQRQFFGQVVARQSVDLAFQVSGQIIELPLIEGAAIKAGDMIAQLDLETFELALDQAQLEKQQADRTLARLNKLGATVSQVAVDDAETAAALANIALRNAESALEHATLHAPFDAVVASRNVANFTTISAGTPVARLHDMSEIRIDIEVPEVLFQRAGATPNLKVSATFPSSDTVYPLEIREFNAETATVGQTYGLTLALSSGTIPHILPGSSATVTAQFLDVDRALNVPVSAIVVAADNSTSVLIFTATQDLLGTVSKRNVSVAPNEQGGFSITDGLAVGDVIVAAGAKNLADGATVRRFDGFAN